MTAADRMELDAKVAVEDFHAVESRLVEMGAKRIGEYREKDTFFDFSAQRLKNSDSALRLRDRQDLNTGKNTYRLTFKGPRQPGQFKHRRENEFSIDQPEQVQAVLEGIGMCPFARCRKRRISWRWRQCGIELDRLDDIGVFVEVEGPDEGSIRETLQKLGLAGEPTLTESYLAMVLKHQSA